MAPSANPKTRIRGAMKSFPAGKQNQNNVMSLDSDFPSIYSNSLKKSINN